MIYPRIYLFVTKKANFLLEIFPHSRKTLGSYHRFISQIIKAHRYPRNIRDS